MVLRLGVPLLQIRNQARERPAWFSARMLAGGAFAAGMVALAEIFGRRLGAGTRMLAAAYPAAYAAGLRLLLDRLLAALFPLISLSQAAAALAYFFGNPDLKLILALPIPPLHFFLMRGARVFATASGFFYLLFIPLLWGFGGKPFAMKALIPLTLYMAIAFFLGLSAVLALANLFRVTALHRAFAVAFALYAVVFILAFRSARPERMFASPAAFLQTLQRPLPAPFLPPARTASTLVDLHLGRGAAVDPLTAGVCLLLGLASCAAFTAGYSRAFSRSRSQAGRKEERVKPRVPQASFFPALAVKEWLRILRSPTRLAQVLLMAGLLFLYIFNLAHLPMKGDPILVPLYKGLHVFLTGFILSALGLRFAFPAASMEGDAVVFFRSLPVSASAVWAAKSAAYFIVFLAVSILLNGAAWFSLPMAVPDFLWMNLAGAVLALLASAGGVALGMVHPKYKNANPLQVGFSPEGLGYFFLSLAATSATAWLFMRSAVLELLG